MPGGTTPRNPARLTGIPDRPRLTELPVGPALAGRGEKPYNYGKLYPQIIGVTAGILRRSGGRYDSTRAAGRPGGTATRHGTDGAAAMTGRAGKTRNIWLTWLVWPFLTLGIYHLVWWYKINREARDFDENISVEPVLSLLAITVGWIIIVPPYVSIYRTGERTAQMQEDAGMERSCNGWIGLLLSFFFGLHTLYYQYELNRIWARLGHPEEGALVALPVAAGGPPSMPDRLGAQPQNSEAEVAQPQPAQPQTAGSPTTEPPAAEPPATEAQAARSGGVPGLSSDGTSNSTPADGDSPTEA